VDDRTWTDLGMDEIRDRADVCFTMAGRNALCRILRHSLPPAGCVEERLSRSEAFRDDTTHRERTASVLSAIGEERDADPVPTTGQDLIEVLLLYLKIYFLIDLIAHDRIVKHILSHRDALRELSQRIGSLDSAFAFATRSRSRSFSLLSSIDIRDNFAEGKSFYYDEAERIYLMIEKLDAQVPALLLIDELLSGTNSLERESASVAILHYLSERNALTIAATHYVTIAHGVEDRYALYYFTDSADENGLTFDYHIQEGVVKTRNAIKLLRLSGYPEYVIRTGLERTEGA